MYHSRNEKSHEDHWSRTS